MNGKKWTPPHIDYRRLDRRAMQLLQAGADLVEAYATALGEQDPTPPSAPAAGRNRESDTP